VATLAAAKEKARALCERDKNPPVTLNTGEIEWYTPPEYLERVRAVLGCIDLDPASSKVAQKTVKANRYFTKVEDALNREWHGRIYMNPPYDRNLCRDLPRSFFVNSATDGSVKPLPSSILSRTRAGSMISRAAPLPFALPVAASPS
jgi:hypothetical protein